MSRPLVRRILGTRKAIRISPTLRLRSTSMRCQPQRSSRTPTRESRSRVRHQYTPRKSMNTAMAAEHGQEGEVAGQRASIAGSWWVAVEVRRRRCSSAHVDGSAEESSAESAPKASAAGSSASGRLQQKRAMLYSIPMSLTHWVGTFDRSLFTTNISHFPTVWQPHSLPGRKLAAGNATSAPNGPRKAQLYVQNDLKCAVET
jgi:hypothetical protein